jgi:hypothetical protein
VQTKVHLSASGHDLTWCSKPAAKLAVVSIPVFVFGIEEESRCGTCRRRWLASRKLYHMMLGEWPIERGRR